MINLVYKAKPRQSDRYWSELPPRPFWLLLKKAAVSIVCVPNPMKSLEIRILM